MASQDTLDTTAPLCTDNLCTNNLCTNLSATHPHTATEATAASKTHAETMEERDPREVTVAAMEERDPREVTDPREDTTTDVLSSTESTDLDLTDYKFAASASP